MEKYFGENIWHLKFYELIHHFRFNVSVLDVAKYLFC